MPGAVADGQLIGAAATEATPTPTATPTDIYSMNSGWRDTTGCPQEVYTGISSGLGVGSSIKATTPTTSSGPRALPSIAAQLVPSCAFTFTTAAGLRGQGEMFIGMGPAYVTLFEKAIVKAGFVQKATTSYTTAYLRGTTGVGLTYVPPNAEGDPYGVVAVFGVN